MSIVTSRIPRVALFTLVLGVAALALTPGDARAGSIMCNRNGNGFANDHRCSYWDTTLARLGGWTGFINPLTTSPDVVAHADGSAKVVQGDTSWPVIAADLAAMLTKDADRMEAKAPKDELDRMRQQKIEAASRTNGNKRVSEKRLQAVADDLKVEIERESR